MTQFLNFSTISIICPYLIGVGAFLFLVGMLINVYYDGLLIKLDENPGSDEAGKSPRTDPSRNRYRIPRGGLFELISGANYFGEIVEWWGLALMTRQSPQVHLNI